MLTFENQCIPGQLSEAKESLDKPTECEKADTASKTAPKGQKKLATATDKRVISPVAVLANVKAAHKRLVYVSAQAEKKTNKART